MTTMEQDLGQPDIEEIERAIRLRLAALRPLVEEYQRLEKAKGALDKALEKLKP